MKRLVVLLALTLIALAAAAGLALAATPRARALGARLDSGVATLGVAPANGVAQVGDEVTVEIEVQSSAPFYGAQAQLRYNPALLDLVDGSVEPGDVFTSVAPAYYWQEPQIDESAGTVFLFPTRRFPAGEFTGAGTLARLRFRAIAAGDASLVLSRALLSNIEGEPLTPDPLVDGLLHILGSVVVTGQVELQGRSGHWQGAVVRLAQVEWPQYIYTTTVTNTDGSWAMNNVATGTYAATVEMARYLDAEKGAVAVSADPTTLTRVRLLGGDVNDDDLVDIVDISSIGGDFGLTVPPARASRDINDDGQIDILDLVLTAGNYMVASPVPWP